MHIVMSYIRIALTDCDVATSWIMNDDDYGTYPTRRPASEWRGKTDGRADGRTRRGWRKEEPASFPDEIESFPAAAAAEQSRADLSSGESGRKSERARAPHRLIVVWSQRSLSLSLSLSLLSGGGRAVQSGRSTGALARARA